ncbi:iron-containing redox enzyme family protein [Streptomyces sp. JJ36]|uniref:iron-containing redox enzyme family protein n=1 Tax=Streptomyces sp. JJ36 TaxID=2736645 RepID=UPI001F1CE922|nr:iron-containing redox enzyme family protein [Streptomyces sp. JJ36]MCF6525839.1 iron-containing redox enzyme family protein [Streptomyces sp. JJ36]
MNPVRSAERPASAPRPAVPVPAARGPLSGLVTEVLAGPAAGGCRAAAGAVAGPGGTVARTEPLGDDLQLALHLCYELHYQGLGGVDPDWEWQPDLLRLRGALEGAFHACLRDLVTGGSDLAAELDALLTEPPDGDGLSHRLRREGTWEQVRELFTHRSVYQLKESDPQAWLVPRLSGRAKAALAAVEFDEFGAGRAERVHSRLFADLMAAAGLDPRYGRYVDAVPGCTLATVNLMSFLGLHRARRGAMAGLFAAAEISSAPGARRMLQVLDRLGAPEACRHFYREHVEADAVHEQLMRREVIGGLLEEEPELRAEVVFGIQAAGFLDGRFTAHVRDRWQRGSSSLRIPLAPAAG